MHSRFDAFRATPLGGQLETLAMSDRRYPEYAALSRAGVPAVAAIVHELLALFPEVAADQVARQFCGAAIAEVMRRHHHEVLRPRGRVPGGLLTYGAVWTPLPARLPFGRLLDALESLPGEIEALFRQVPAPRKRDRPAGSGLSAVEHLCHLRDLDAVHEARIRLILTGTLPDLPSVDGLALAAERRYGTQDPAEALDGLRRGRASLTSLLRGTSEAERGRVGLRDGVRRVSLLELAEEIHRHDRTHVQECHELAAEMGGISAKAE